MILFYCYVIYSFAWIYPVSLIHSSVDDHFNCFQFLTITNKVAMNVHMQVGICTNFSRITMENHSITWSEVAGTQGSRHTQRRCQFSKVVEQIYTPTSNKWPFSCSTSSLSIDIVSPFAVNQSVLSHCDFNLHFLDE